MVQQPLDPQPSSAGPSPSGAATDSGDGVVVFLPDFPAQRAQLPHAPARIRRRVMCQIVVLEVMGNLSDVLEDLDRSIQLALADAPRGVICDLSEVVDDSGLDAVDVLATAGRYVRDWSGVPVALVYPERRVRDALADHPLGGHLIVTPSMLPAVAAVLVTPIPTVEWLRVAPHPTALPASRDFVTHTLLDWGLDRLVLSVGLVVTELVARSMSNASTEIDVSIACNLEALRVTVRDNSHDPRRPRHPLFERPGQKLSAVGGLSRACGTLPTQDGGKVAWAVLNAARPRAWNGPVRP